MDGSLPGTVHTRVATPMLPTARAAAAASAATASRLRPAAAAAPATCAFVHAIGRTVAHAHAGLVHVQSCTDRKLCPRHLAYEQAHTTCAWRRASMSLMRSCGRFCVQ